MSKSINDYKEAMDNIKISESFYKRTEILLTELPEVKIEKRPVLSGRRISAVIMSAAACVICLFGVKLAMDGRQADIVTETVTNVSGESGTMSESDKGADELIDDFGEYDDAGIIAESIAPDVPTESKPVAVNPATSPETEPAKTTSSDKPSTTTTVTTAPPQNETGKSTTASEKRVVPGIDPYNPSASAQSELDYTEEPTAAMPNPGASGGVSTDEYDYDEEEDIMDYEEEYDEAAPVGTVPSTAAAESGKWFSELSIDNITVDITPYFNMDDIKSGEGTVKKSGTEFKPVLDLIANMDSSATKIGNGSFTSLFSIRIYDENIGLEFYSIYLTKHESIVITKHSPDGSQVRETYALRKEYYESVKYQLFLLFGTEGDYELFTNLIGGK